MGARSSPQHDIHELADFFLSNLMPEPVPALQQRTCETRTGVRQRHAGQAPEEPTRKVAEHIGNA